MQPKEAKAFADNLVFTFLETSALSARFAEVAFLMIAGEPISQGETSRESGGLDVRVRVRALT